MSKGSREGIQKNHGSKEYSLFAELESHEALRDMGMVVEGGGYNGKGEGRKQSWKDRSGEMGKGLIG